MIRKLYELPAVLTCFAYRQEYVEELDGMLATVKEHHPNWQIVVGRGPVSGFDMPTLEVDSPSGTAFWTLPVSPNLNGSKDDWCKFTLMKGWWIAQVWGQFTDFSNRRINRFVWIDADSRLNGPLDIELEVDAEIVAGPWEYEPEPDHIASGLLVFQGIRCGPVARILDKWSSACLKYIPGSPASMMPWGVGDQEVLTEVLNSFDESASYQLIKLDLQKYSFNVDPGVIRRPGALVESWQMNRKVRFPHQQIRNWPPPEKYRRQKVGPHGLRVKQEDIWSIGIYTGETPFELQSAREVENPVLSSKDVSDIEADFVADPFMIKADETWHMFFEVMNGETGTGQIGWATSENAMDWSYRRIVLREAFHLSYPQVFRVGGEYYMVPESFRAKSIRLYRADPFPTDWSLVNSLMGGIWVDPTLFFFNGLWWMFASPAPGTMDTLELHYAETINGPWRGHAMNPLIKGNNRMARPGGRVIVYDDKVIRFTQDCFPYYGTRVRAFEVLELTPASYREREAEQSPILSAGTEEWRQAGMHHIDPHFVDGRWLACVDGWRFRVY